MFPPKYDYDSMTWKTVKQNVEKVARLRQLRAAVKALKVSQAIIVQTNGVPAEMVRTNVLTGLRSSRPKVHSTRMGPKVIKFWRGE